MSCSTESHELLKLDEEAWRALPLDGYQPRVAEDEPDYESRTHCDCGSTLFRECCLTEEQREAANRENVARNARIQAAVRAAMGRP